MEEQEEKVLREGIREWWLSLGGSNPVKATDSIVQSLVNSKGGVVVKLMPIDKSSGWVNAEKHGFDPAGDSLFQARVDALAAKESNTERREKRSKSKYLTHQESVFVINNLESMDQVTILYQGREVDALVIHASSLVQFKGAVLKRGRVIRSEASNVEAMESSIAKKEFDPEEF